MSPVLTVTKKPGFSGNPVSWTRRGNPVSWTATALLLSIVWTMFQLPANAAASRLKDVATLQGLSPAPLVGYGLVVGLNKTGDKRQTIFSTQTLANMLSRFGVEVPAEQLKVENIAAVVVTAEVLPYQRVGARIDVVASSIGDARSLQGGTLLPTALRGPMGEMVALAQGPLSIGGFGGGTGGSSVAVNHLTVGRIPSGAIVQAAQQGSAMPSGNLTFALRDPDFVTASHIAQAINAHLGLVVARPVDPGSVSVVVPDRFKDSVPELMAELETLSVESDIPARVVINERTGTVVVGGDVRLAPAAVAHGNLSVRITTRYQVSQPAPFSNGETTVVPQEKVDVQEGRAKLVSLEEGVTLDAVTNALNQLGASPRDIIAIMQALKAAGALRAEIVIL
jgi:flagellar P-ring protein precursor FlgI